MPESNLSRDFVPALSINFVEQFGLRLNSLFELLGMHRIISMPVGSTIKTYTSSVTLDNAPVAPGAVIPLSEVKLEDGPAYSLAFRKSRKAVPIEDIQTYGFETAVARSDEKYLNALQKEIRDGLLGNLATGTKETEGSGFKALLAKNTGAVKVAFDEDDPEVISFVNTLDVYDYLGDAELTTQTAFGMSYLEGFLDNKIVFMSGDVPQGTIYSTAVDNLVFGHAAVGGEMSKAFDFTLQADGYIGVIHNVDTKRLTAETTAISGNLWLAERLDGVIVGTIETPEG